MRSKVFSQKSLIFYGTLNKDDMVQIDKLRGMYNKLGFTYQLIFVRLFNYFPKIVQFEVIDELLIYAALQLSINSTDISIYQKNRTKISDHQQEIIKYLNLTLFNEVSRVLLEEFMFRESLRLESFSLLKTEAVQFLKSNRILSPTEETLNRLIVSQRKKGRNYIFDTIHSRLPTSCITKLKELISTKDQYSKLDMLKKPPDIASAGTILNLIERLNLIKDTGLLSINISDISSNYQKILAKEIKLYSVNRIQLLGTTQKNTALVCFLHQTYKDITDYLIEAYIKVLNTVYKRARTAEENNVNKKKPLNSLL